MLLRLHLIELIRNHLASPSPWSLSALLEFASQSLAPRAQHSSTCLADLEQTMSLLCFPAEVLDAGSRKLLHTETRQRVAERVNAALLESQGIAPEAKVKGLVRLFMWQEKKQADAAAAATAAAQAPAGTASVAGAAGTSGGGGAGTGGDVTMRDVPTTAATTSGASEAALQAAAATALTRDLGRTAPH